MQLRYSFIIPVYNRPNEIAELLKSFNAMVTALAYEIIIIEDGSTKTSKHIINAYSKKLNLRYQFKKNTGPGDSRNFGMHIATGNYFIILDSDVILPTNYLDEVNHSLNTYYVDCYGGPDTAHKSFNNMQKAINFSMTSVITTGGIRGNKKALDRFQPRSFNMGISKKAFLASKGFKNIHPGEDPELSFRLWTLGFKTKLIPEAVVYHKRRLSWQKFFTQTYKFGLVRPILNMWHPTTKKITYWFPSLYSIGLCIAFFLLLLGNYWIITCYLLYYSIAFFIAFYNYNSFKIAIMAVYAITIQFFGYGFGFLKSTFIIRILKKIPEDYFPNLFFSVK